MRVDAPALPPSAETLAHGRRCACALLGVDARYREESGDGDGLVVVKLAGSDALTPDAFASYADARAEWRALGAGAAALPEPDRRIYYAQLARSTLAFIDWRERGLPFAAQLEGFLHVSAAPADEAELDALRAAMRGLLDRMGYAGDLSAQCAAWESRNRVAPEAVARTLTDLLAEAWERTERHLVRIPAARADAMAVAAVSGVAFNARCDYLRRTVEVNTDPVLTRPALKHLAAHEGCPGHYLQFKLREDAVARGDAAADVLLSVVNTASSSVFEGIADAGMDVIGWIENDDDRLQDLLNRYRAGIGTAAAWRLHADGWPPARVADWLRSVSLVGGDGWVDNRMRFIAAPSRAVLIWSYWAGAPALARAWAGVGKEARRAFVHYIYGRMHSLETVELWHTRRADPPQAPSNPSRPRQ